MTLVPPTAWRACLCIAGLCLLLASSAATAFAQTSACDPVAGMADAEALPITKIRDCLSSELANIQDISLHVDALISTGAQGESTKLTLQAAARLPDLLRYEITSPSSLAGMIQLLDKSNGTMSTYYPVTNTVVVGPLAQLADRQGLPFDVSQVLSLPPADTFALSLLDATDTGGRVLLQVSAHKKDQPDAPTLLFWIDAQTWLLTRMQTRDANGATQLDLTFADVEINKGLTPQALRRMPDGAVVKHM